MLVTILHGDADDRDSNATCFNDCASLKPQAAESQRGPPPRSWHVPIEADLQPSILQPKGRYTQYQSQSSDLFSGPLHSRQDNGYIV